MTRAVLHVFVFRDGAYVGSEVFLEPELVIGSGEGSDLVLDDPGVADAHAILSREDEQVSLLDLGHGLGSQVNGAPVQHAAVGPRDEIVLGRHLLKLKVVKPKPPEARAVPRASAPPAPRPAPEAQEARTVPRGSAPPAPRPAPEAQEAPSRPRASGPPAPVSEPPGAPASDLVLPESPARNERLVPTEVTRERRATDDLDEILERELRADLTPVPEGIGDEDVLDEAAVDALGPASDLDGDAREPGGDRWSPLPDPSASAPERAGFGSLDEALASAFAPVDPPERPPDELATVATPLSKLLGPQRSAASELEASFAGEETEATPLQRHAVEDPFAVGSEALTPALPTAPGASTPSASEAAPEPLEARAEREAPSAVAARSFVASEAPDLATPEPAGAPVAEAPAPGEGPADARFVQDDDEELDEEEAEALEPPGFSLLEELVRGAEGPDRSPPALELIASERGEVRRVELLAPRRRARLAEPRAGLRRVRAARDGAMTVWFAHDAQGMLLDEGRKVPLDNHKLPANAVSKRADAYALTLRPGQSLTLRSGEAACHLRFVAPPALPPRPRPGPRRRLSGPVPRALGSSLLVHAAVAMGVALTTPAVSFSEAPREVWAEVDLDEVRPVEVPPPPPPEVEPEPEPPEPKPEPKAKKPRRRPPPSPKRQRRTRARKGKPAREVKKAGVLGALGSMDRPAPGKKSMVAAASNLDAVKAPGESGYRVGPLIGKAPSSDVRLGGGGGGKPLTRGSADLLRGGSGFAKIGKKSGAKVRGKVGRVVTRKVRAKKGQISREEVSRVLNQHLHEVQGCYERALIAKPGLRGKITLEWTIRTNGRVSGVKQKFSSLKDASVARCIMAKLKGWRFPKPRGGVVQVSYPWNFAPTSY